MRGSFEQLQADEVYAGVVRRTFNSEHATVTSYAFEPGAEFPVHRHPQEQVTVVESGEVEMTIGDRVEALGVGDFTVVAGDVEHGVRAGAAGARILAIVMPPRASSDAYTVVADGA